MYQLEDDFFFRGNTMASMGRDSLFRVLNPSQRMRLVVEFSASLNNDRQNKLPDGSVVGDKRLMLSSEGRGSARLFSEIVDPQWIGQEPYVMLDWGTWGLRFPDSRSWITGLWGNDIRADPRRIVGFARDVSLISEEEYLEMSPPSEVMRFPQDLINKALEYSGLYEDGWTGEADYVVLTQSALADKLSVSLMVPQIDRAQPPSECVVRVDGTEVARHRLRAGEIYFDAPVASCSGCKRKIELRFDRVMSLPAPDGRPVSAQVQYIGFRATGSRHSKAGGEATAQLR
jgi:hypothetical protein